MDPALIRRIEELSLNALPALQTEVYDGWILRRANGYTRRANSINPLYPSTLPLAEKVARCEARYAGERHGVIFKLTPAAQPADLDAALGELGYTREAPTSVQTLDLGSPGSHPGPTARPAGTPDRPGPAEVLTTLSPRWLEPFCQMNQVPPDHQVTLQQILAKIRAATGYLLLTHEGIPVACGLGVVEDGWVGIFDIVTHSEHRQQGYGLALMQSLLDWARTAGARQAYLQVMASNQSALRLYEKLGFRERYRYWYRTRKG